jgi:hypothetical protein
MMWEPEATAFNATTTRAGEGGGVPWHQRAIPLPVLGVFSAFLAIGQPVMFLAEEARKGIMRRIEARRTARRSNLAARPT